MRPWSYLDPNAVRVFSTQPVAEHARRRGITDAELGYLTGRTTKDAARRWWQRMNHYGLTIDEADDLAAGLGLHVSELWPEYWEIAAAISVLVEYSELARSHRRTEGASA